MRKNANAILKLQLKQFQIEDNLLKDITRKLKGGYITFDAAEKLIKDKVTFICQNFRRAIIEVLSVKFSSELDADLEEELSQMIEKMKQNLITKCLAALKKAGK